MSRSPHGSEAEEESATRELPVRVQTTSSKFWSNTSEDPVLERIVSCDNEDKEDIASNQKGQGREVDEGRPKVRERSQSFEDYSDVLSESAGRDDARRRSFREMAMALAEQLVDCLTEVHDREIQAQSGDTRSNGNQPYHERGDRSPPPDDRKILLRGISARRNHVQGGSASAGLRGGRTSARLANRQPSALKSRRKMRCFSEQLSPLQMGHIAALSSRRNERADSGGADSGGHRDLNRSANRTITVSTSASHDVMEKGATVAALSSALEQVNDNCVSEKRNPSSASTTPPLSQFFTGSSACPSNMKLSPVYDETIPGSVSHPNVCSGSVVSEERKSSKTTSADNKGNQQNSCDTLSEYATHTYFFDLREALQLPDYELDALRRKRSIKADSGVLPMSSEGPKQTPGDSTYGSSYVLHPQSKARLFWDVSAICLLCYDIMIIPLQVYEFQWNLTMEVMEWIVIFYWSVDMIMSFFTGVYVKGKLIMEKPLIARQYLKTWFAFDVLILLPEWITRTILEGSSAVPENAAGLMRAFRSSRFLRILRLLRIVKVEKTLADIKARVNSHGNLLAISITRLILSVIFCIHILACAWFWLGMRSNDGWVYVEGVDKLPPGERWLYSFLWSMARLHPSSYEKSLMLMTVHERIFAISVSLASLGGGAVFISSITNTMADLLRVRRERTRKMWIVREYVQDHHISAQLSVRVKKYVQKSTNRKLGEQLEDELKQFVPMALMMDLHFEAWSHVIAVHPFFGSFCAAHPRTVWSMCSGALKEAPVVQSDIVFTTGDSCGRMLFVMSGELLYTLGKSFGKKRRSVRPPTSIEASAAKVQLHKRFSFSDLVSSASIATTDTPVLVQGHGDEPVTRGEWVSEAALWTHWDNRGELIARVDSTLLALWSEAFIDTLGEHPNALLDAFEYAILLIEWLNENEVTTTDILQPRFDHRSLPTSVPSYTSQCSGQPSGQAFDAASPEDDDSDGRFTNIFAGRPSSPDLLT